MYEGGDGKNRETFLRIPDESSKPRNFSPSKLLPFTVSIYHKEGTVQKASLYKALSYNNTTHKQIQNTIQP